jgi:hypothetical protein
LGWKGGFAMFKDVIERFRWWITCKEVRSATFSLANAFGELSDCVNSLSSRVKLIEAAEKSRKDALESIVCAEGIEVSALKCDDCISMRLEMDTIKSRLEALEVAKKNGCDGNGGQLNSMYATPASDKPKLRRRRSDAKKLVA